MKDSVTSPRAVGSVNVPLARPPGCGAMRIVPHPGVSGLIPKRSWGTTKSGEVDQAWE